MWLEGDNPSNSTDSRTYGPIPLAMVRARVFFRVRHEGLHAELSRPTAYWPHGGGSGVLMVVSMLVLVALLVLCLLASAASRSLRCQRTILSLEPLGRCPSSPVVYFEVCRCDLCTTSPLRIRASLVQQGGKLRHYDPPPPSSLTLSRVCSCLWRRHGRFLESEE